MYAYMGVCESLEAVQENRLLCEAAQKIPGGHGPAVPLELRTCKNSHPVGARAYGGVSPVARSAAEASRRD